MFYYREPVAATDCAERIVSAKGQYMYSDGDIQYLDMRNNVHHGKLVYTNLKYASPYN